MTGQDEADRVKRNQGWECPRCERINAPYMKECLCRPDSYEVYIAVGGSNASGPIKTDISVHGDLGTGR